MIYFARLSSGAVKIGCSDDVKVRMLSLQSTYMGKSTLLLTMEGNLETEQVLHRKFSHLRFGRTEQFRPGSDLMRFIGVPAVDNDAQIEPTQKVIRKTTSKRVMMSLNQEAVDCLDYIIKRVPDVQNRSAAVRYVVRVATEHLERLNRKIFENPEVDS